MNKIAVVYWSGTGNTEAMAEAVAEGIKSGGSEAQIFSTGEFDASMINSYDAIAFGCPAMGAERLEDFEFEPLYESCRPFLSGKKLALFGSYGWGDGQWMRSWEESCRESGAILASDSVICSGYPEAEGLENCRALGRSLTH